VKRNAFVMHLKSRNGGRVQETARRDLAGAQSGAPQGRVSDYSIYLDRKTNTLFAFQYLADDATDGGCRSCLSSRSGGT
jgi:L-rhamnose mutarotase